MDQEFVQSSQSGFHQSTKCPKVVNNLENNLCINTRIPCKQKSRKKKTCLLKEIGTQQRNNVSETSSKLGSITAMG